MIDFTLTGVAASVPAGVRGASHKVKWCEKLE